MKLSLSDLHANSELNKKLEEIYDELRILERDSKNKVFFIFFHEILVFLTSALKNQDDFSMRIVDGVFQTKLNGKIDNELMYYRRRLEQHRKISKMQQLLSKISHIIPGDKIYVSPTMQSIRKNKLNVFRKHSYVNLTKDDFTDDEISQVIDLIRNTKFVQKYKLDFDFIPLVNHFKVNAFRCEIKGPVVLRTLTKSVERTIAYYAKIAQVDITVVAHGLISTSAFKEPAFEYGYPSDVLILDYGTFSTRKSARIPFKQRKLKSFPRREKHEDYIYVPTSLSGHITYGPFRSISDNLYIKHWSNIQSIFKNVIIKAHPKQALQLPEGFTYSTKSMRETLKLDAIFIFDYVSTALLEAIEAKSKIIFLDIGIRKLHPQFIRDLAKVTTYICVHQDGYQNSLANVKAPNQNQVRVFLDKYSGDSSNLLLQLNYVRN